MREPAHWRYLMECARCEYWTFGSKFKRGISRRERYRSYLNQGANQIPLSDYCVTSKIGGVPVQLANTAQCCGPSASCLDLPVTQR